MKKTSINPNDNKTNQTNANKGSTGTNRQYDQAQGNRGKQKNPNQKGKSKTERCSVTFHIPESKMDYIDLAGQHLRAIKTVEAGKRGLKTIQGYKLLEFTKGIKAVSTGLNHSGALQRIASFTESTGIRTHWRYWIADHPCINTTHPEALSYPLEYCPAIDGY